MAHKKSHSNTGTTIIDFHLLTCTTTLGKCLTAITILISSDFLHPNASKIEVLVFGPDSFSEEVSHYVVPPPRSDYCKSLHVHLCVLLSLSPTGANKKLASKYYI